MSPESFTERHNPASARECVPAPDRPHAKPGGSAAVPSRAVALPTAYGPDGHVLVGDGHAEVWMPLSAVLGEDELRAALRVFMAALRQTKRPVVPQHRTGGG